jgi:ferrochelatase
MVRHAFRHSPPYAGDVLADVAAHGVRRIVAVPAYPQAARSTRGSAVRDILRAGRRARVLVCIAPSFPDGPGYIQALIDLAGPLLHAGSHLVMSAHGIPRRAVRKGDTYLEEVARTERAFVERLPPGISHSLAYQSRVGPMAWTGPILRDEVGRLAREGVSRLVVAPLSFVCENLETIYELDFELAAHARECGIAFARVPTPGCHPAFISEMARLARRAARDAGWEDADVC